MSKLTKSKLKSIVKECLVEILAEGIDVSESSSLTESRKRARKKQVMVQEEARLANHRKKFETQVSSAVNTITDDPIMQGILADTARTTLQEQIANEPNSGAAPAMSSPGGNTGAGINLDSIFSDSKSSWSDLAFTEKKPV